MKALPSPLPLCVDLDGTLTYADLSVESLVNVASRAPWLLPNLLMWRLRGKHCLKDQLAQRASIDISVLPYNESVIALVQEARERGRRTVLVTGSSHKFAAQVQDHLGIFDDVMASDDTCNLTGQTKAEKLNDAFGIGQYEYVANGATDLPVWKSAASVVTVNTSRSIAQKAAALGKPHRDLPVEKSSVRIWRKALRLHQWAKNALLFVPLLMAHAVFDWTAVSAVMLAFLCFGLCASGNYIINDLFDLSSDRNHPKKRLRPFASGQLSVKQGVLACILCIGTGLGLSFLLPLSFQLSLVTYMAVSLLYSFRLKKMASLDVLTLAGLYTIRVAAGAFAAGLALSFWLLAFSMFMFLSLAIVKRVAELTELRDRQPGGTARLAARGREYSTEDATILKILGATSGYQSVLVLALYINSPDVIKLYPSPEILWLIAPLILLWLTRLWLLTVRGHMDEDPILFAVKDPETWLTAAVTMGIMFAASTLDLF